MELFPFKQILRALDMLMTRDNYLFDDRSTACCALRISVRHRSRRRSKRVAPSTSGPHAPSALPARSGSARRVSISSRKPKRYRLPCLKLVIGNKNYSSWSMRPWVLLRAGGHPVRRDPALVRRRRASRIGVEPYSPTRQVPVLLVDGAPVWDSLAICETVAELFPERRLWPDDPRARAHGALDLRRDARRVSRPAQRDAHEHPRLASRARA